MVLLSNIIKSHILKADQKRQKFIPLISLAEDEDVIDFYIYNILRWLMDNLNKAGERLIFQKIGLSEFSDCLTS